MCFIASNIELSTISNSNNENELNAISGSLHSWENAELKTELKLSRAEIQTLLSKLSLSNSKLDTLTDCLQEDISEKVIAQEETNALKNELSDLKLEQELCVQKLGDTLQKLNYLSSKNIKMKICRREQTIAEFEVANKQILIKLNEAFLNEEKLKEEVSNSAAGNNEYAEEIII